MYSSNIHEQARNNTHFRTVVHTGVYSQLVLMSLLPGEDIGAETHQHVDQFFYFVQGTCETTVGDETKTVAENEVVFVPAGTLHNFKNIGTDSLKLFTLYSPPQHPDGTVHITKSDAQEAETHEG